jgi:dihydroorotase
MSGYSLHDVRLIGFAGAPAVTSVHVDGRGIVRAEAAPGAREIDCGGAYLSPGWADLHVHVWYGGTDFSVRAAEAGLCMGVTAMADAGSAGEASFHGLREYVLERQRETIKAFINIGSIGLVAANRISELGGPGAIDVERTLRVIETNRDVICGIKVRCSGVVVGEWGVEPLRIAREVAHAAGLPLMVHIGEAPPEIEDVMGLLEAGDLVTHCFHGKPGTALFETAERIALARDAVERGVRFDVGHGAASYSFEMAGRALELGFVPFSISTDLHQRNLRGPVYDLATTASKLLAVGLPLDECVEAITNRPRSILGLHSDTPLAPGAYADFTVFRVGQGDEVVTDSLGHSMRLATRLLPEYAALGPIAVRANGAASSGRR